MVAFSTLPLLTSLGGLLLLATDLPWPLVFDLCSGFVILFAAVATVFVWREVVALHSSRAELGRVGRTMLHAGVVAGIIALAFQIYNLAALHAFWPFYAGIVISVGAATIQFTRLVLTRAHPRI
jgi:hypothetical protein